MIYLPRFRAWDIKNKKMGEPDIIINNERVRGKCISRSGYEQQIGCLLA